MQVKPQNKTMNMTKMMTNKLAPHMRKNKMFTSSADGLDRLLLILTQGHYIN